MQGRQRRLCRFGLTGLLGVLACGCSPNLQPPEAINQTEAIKRRDARLQTLERRIGSTADDKTPPGPVTSLTLRLGTVDDRLRIYWEDGSTTNLPCTEEQNTWVCG